MIHYCGEFCYDQNGDQLSSGQFDTDVSYQAPFVFLFFLKFIYIISFYYYYYYYYYYYNFLFFFYIIDNPQILLFFYCRNVHIQHVNQSFNLGFLSSLSFPLSPSPPHFFFFFFFFFFD